MMMSKRVGRSTGRSLGSAHPAGDPARGSRHRVLVRRALAGARKKASEEGRVIPWVDECGFCLLPAAVRTYAPRGQPPILRVPLSRDHLSVISAISSDGELFLMVQERALDGADVARFLRHLLEIVPDPLLVIWDGGPIRRGQPVRDLLAEVGRDRLLVERLPAYAPELNPDEGIWNYLKRVELRNTCCTSLRHLREALREAAIRLCQKPDVIRGCSRQAGYHVHPVLR
jgi:transposase